MNSNSKIQKKDLEISERYETAMEQLTSIRYRNLEVYHGGTVSRRDNGLSWVSPAILFNDGNESKSVKAVYHLAYVNFDPTITPTTTPILIPFIGCETGIKCAGEDCICDDRFQELLNLYKDRPFIVLRRSFLSNPAFPYITKYSKSDPRTEQNMFDEIIRLLGDSGLCFELSSGFLDFGLDCVFGEIPLLVDNVDLTIYGPRRITNQEGVFYGYSVAFKSDIWENYEIISGQPLSLGEVDGVIVRFDSGCDSGQIYDDTACDCRDQFHSALRSIKLEGQGIIIHIPSHDGRGYGMAGKMETELYKAGKRGFVHDPQTHLDTVKAAELLYGDKYDIRTYKGAAQILRALGVRQVRVLTDNAEKFKAIKAEGIHVERVRTDTHKEDCEEHIVAKHRTPPYNDEAWAEC